MSEVANEAVDTLKQFLAAVMAMDHPKLMSFVDEDAQMFSPLGDYPARLDGRAAIGEQFATMMETIRTQQGGNVNLDPQDLSARELAPNVTLVTFHLHLPGPLHRRSCLMTRGATGWRIAHIHASLASPVGLSNPDPGSEESHLQPTTGDGA